MSYSYICRYIGFDVVWKDVRKCDINPGPARNKQAAQQSKYSVTARAIHDASAAALLAAIFFIASRIWLQIGHFVLVDHLVNCS